MNRKTFINPNVMFRNNFFNTSQPSGSDSRNIHVNPNFARPCNVHFNPRVVNMGHLSVSKELPKPDLATNTSKFLWKRNPEDVNPYLRMQPKKIPNTHVYLSPTKRKLVRKNVSTETKSFKKLWGNHQRFKYSINKVSSPTKFKVDKRLSRSKLKIVHSTLENLFPKPIFKYNRHKKVQPSASNKRPSLKTQNNSSNKKLVNIGGISYKVTSKKMTRTSPTKDRNAKKPDNRTIINIQGAKYMVSDNGAKLQRLPSSSAVTKPRARLDFGGVTYRQHEHSADVMLRTNSHAARLMLLQARQRSIACLAARRRKVNTPCLVFRKFGRCRRNDQGCCIYAHDKKSVDLCKRYLRGECKDKNCLLSHDVVKEKIATCQYYLQGTCARDDCPYLHVKLSAKADICPAFLQGYCAEGEQCSKRHVNICPEFEKVGICKKGKKCPYPHKKQKRKRESLNCGKFKFNAKAKRKRGASGDKEVESSGELKRYYASASEPTPAPGPSQENLHQGLVPSRQQVPTLPSFISLSKS